MQPETTHNNDNTTSSTITTSNNDEKHQLFPSINKTYKMDPGFNSEMTRKFARILQKEEKVS